MTDDTLEQRFEGQKLILETASRSETFDSKFLVAVLLVYIAKGDGTIAAEETAEMLSLIGEHFHMRSSESLELLTRAIASIADDPGLGSVLRASSAGMDDTEKRELAAMMLRVIGADGTATVDEMEALKTAGEIVGISARVMHEAYDAYVAEIRSPRPGA